MKPMLMMLLLLLDLHVQHLIDLLQLLDLNLVRLQLAVVDHTVERLVGCLDAELLETARHLVHLSQQRIHVRMWRHRHRRRRQ